MAGLESGPVLRRLVNRLTLLDHRRRGRRRRTPPGLLGKGCVRPVPAQV